MGVLEALHNKVMAARAIVFRRLPVFALFLKATQQ
jgi:hypothetical protein